MPKERQGYRETIHLMTEAGIGFLVNQQELAQFYGCEGVYALMEAAE